MQPLLDRYIARLMFVPLAATLVISAMLLLLVRMADLFDLVITEGGSGETVLRVLANLTPQYLALGIPLGLLMGVLLAFRRLSLDNELDAMMGMGISCIRMLKMPMLIAMGLAVLTVFVVGFVQPLSVYDHEKLLFDLNSGGLGVSIRVGEFTPLGDKLVVRAERSQRGGRDLHGVFATSTDPDGRMVVFSAARAQLRTADDGESTIARLFDGTVAHIDPATGTNRTAGFATYDIPLSLPAIPEFRARGGAEREMTLTELWRVASDPASAALDIQHAQAGLYRRAAQVLVLFLLPLLAVPLARPPLRTTSGLGVFLGIAGFIIYNELSLFGERLGISGQMSPLPAQAISFLVFALLCLSLFFVFALLPGEPPLSRLMHALSFLRRSPMGRLASAQVKP
jgi:lipopolysaccharide export system permease protein